MSIRELFGMAFAKSALRTVSLPTTVRARPQLEALETRVALSDMGGLGVTVSVSTTPQVVTLGLAAAITV